MRRKFKIFTFNVGLVSVLANDLERPMLDILLNSGVIKLATNKTLGVEDSVVRIHGRLILRSITDQSLGLSECHPRRSRTVALIICDDLNTFILPDPNT